MCSWSVFGAWMTHGHTQTHHGPNLGEATTFPLIVFSMISHKGNIQMSFCFETPKLGVSKFLKLGLWKFWKPIISCTDLWLRWGLNKSCSPYQELFNDMWHGNCMQVIQGDSQILMVGGQIGILTLDLSFGHNLCYKYSNGS